MATESVRCEKCGMAFTRLVGDEENLCSACEPVLTQREAEIVIPETAVVALVETHPSEPIPAPSVHLVARDPQQMAAAQAGLSDWLTRRVSACLTEVSELELAVGEAKKHKWKSSTLQNQYSRSLQRKMFYQKCMEAVNAGFTIIPNIPIDLFAIRVKRKEPTSDFQTLKTNRSWEEPRARQINPDVMEAGLGSYKSPNPITDVLHEEETNKDGQKEYTKSSWRIGFDDIEFPIIAAVPEVMTAAQQAMSARIFDQIGISPQRNAPKGDPLIIGQILGTRSGYGGARKTISFLIAWHLDLRTL